MSDTDAPKERRLDISISVMFDQNSHNVIEEHVGTVITNADSWTFDMQRFLADVAGEFEIPESEE